MTQREEVVGRIAGRIAAVRARHPVRVAVDGVDAAGKTVLADELAATLERLGRPVIRASVDGFHNPRVTRYRQGALSPSGYFEDSFNTAALLEHLLHPLGPGGSGWFRRAAFDFRTDEPVAAAMERAPADAVLVLDGVFLLRDELHRHFEFSVFVRAAFEITLARAEQRDARVFGSVEAVRQRYQQRYIPGQQLYFERAQPERRASVVVDNNDSARPGIVVGMTASGTAGTSSSEVKSMDNVKLLKGLYDAFGRGDIPAVLGAMSPDIKWYQAEGNPYRPSGEAWVGPDAVLKNLFMRLGGEWDGFAVHPKSFYGAGDSVIVEARYSGTYKATGRSMDTQVCHVWDVKDGKVTRFQQYVDTAKLWDVMGAK